MKYFVGLLALLGLAAGLTFGGYTLWDHAVATRTGADDNGGVIGGGPSGGTDTTATTTPAPKQVTVTGTVFSLHAEGAVMAPLALPLTITTPERGEGSGATIKAIMVDGKPSSIEWDAGLPFELSSEGDGGALVVAPLTVDADRDHVYVSYDDAAHGFAPGSYHLDTPVAVGTGGLATPVKSVTFDATAASTVTFRGNASTTFDAHDLSLRGPGRVVLDGDLTVLQPDGSKTRTLQVTLDTGPFQIDLAFGKDGYAINQVTLQGVIHTL